MEVRSQKEPIYAAAAKDSGTKGRMRLSQQRCHPQWPKPSKTSISWWLTGGYAIGLMGTTLTDKSRKMGSVMLWGDLQIPQPPLCQSHRGGRWRQRVGRDFDAAPDTFDPFHLAGITFNGEGHRVEPTSLGRPSLWTWCFWVNRGYGYSGLKVLSEVQYTTRLLSQTQLGISMDFKGQNFGTNVNELTPRCFQMGRPEEKVHTLRAASLWGCGTLPQRWDPKLTHTLTRTDKLD